MKNTSPQYPRSRVSNRLTSFKTAAVLSFAFVSAVSSAHAASGTWNVDADGNWTTTASNWLGSTIPGTTAGDTANLSYDFTAARTISLTTTRTVGILSLGDTNGTHAVTLQGSSTNFTFDNGSNNAQLNQLSTGKGATVTGVTLIVGGNGNLVVSNASTTGSLVIDSSIAGSGSGAKTVTVNTAGTVDFDDNRTVSNGSGGGTLALVKSGTGTLQLRGSGSYSGGFTLNTGTLEFGFNQNALGTGTFTINGGVITNGYGASRTLSTNNAQIWAGNFTYGISSAFGSDLNLGTGAVSLTGNRTVTVSSTSTSRRLTVGGVISGEGFSLTKAGTATLALGGANTYNGGTIVSAGTLATLSTGTFGTGDISLTGTTGKLTLGNSASIADTASLSFISTMAAGSINLNFTGTEILAGIFKTNGTPASIVSGLYTAAELNSFFGTSIFTGGGSFQFGSIPEPSSYAAALGGFVLAGVMLRRRR